MSRIIRIAAAQMGPTQRTDSRADTLARLITLLEQSARQGADLVVFPELALTTFFPRWLLEGQELQDYFEKSMPNPTACRQLSRMMIEANFTAARKVDLSLS